MEIIVKTLEQFLVERINNGVRILPLVLEYFSPQFVDRFHQLAAEKATSRNTTLRTIALWEYYDALEHGSIPRSTSFESYYADGDIPEQYGLSLLLSMMDKMLLTRCDKTYLYLYHIIDNWILGTYVGYFPYQ